MGEPVQSADLCAGVRGILTVTLARCVSELVQFTIGSCRDEKHREDLAQLPQVVGSREASCLRRL